MVFPDVCLRLPSAAASEAIRNFPGRPLIITDVANHWNAATDWRLHNLENEYGSRLVRLKGHGQPSMTLSQFIAYVKNNANGDVNPQYVFDHVVWPELLEDYDPSVGNVFPHDYFKSLGSARKAFRWFLVGPSRSGSKPHVDPDGTGAWNALVVGRKRWAVVDPEAITSGIVSAADIEAKPGQTISDWFREQFPFLRARFPDYAKEFFQEQGEVVYMPAGVWHAVLNFSDTVAVTQNFVGPAEFRGAFRALSNYRPCLARDWLRRLRSDVQSGKQSMPASTFEEVCELQRAYEPFPETALTHDTRVSKDCSGTKTGPMTPPVQLQAQLDEASTILTDSVLHSHDAETRLRAHWLVITTSLSSGRVEDAWNAATTVIDLLRLDCLPAEDTLPLCQVLALLAAAMCQRGLPAASTGEVIQAVKLLHASAIGTSPRAWDDWLAQTLPFDLRLQIAEIPCGANQPCANIRINRSTRKSVPQHYLCGPRSNFRLGGRRRGHTTRCNG